MALQNLSKKGIVKVKKMRGKEQLNITFLPDATPILTELSYAKRNFKQAMFAGFTEEELKQYEELSEKIKINMQKIL